MRARTILVSILAVTAATQPMFLLATGAPIIGDELGFGPSMLGVFTGVFFLTASLSSARGGHWVERIGWPLAMRISTSSAAILMFLFAAFARSPAAVIVILVLAATVYGAVNPAANLALATNFEVDRQGLLFGVKHAGIPSSILLAGLAVPALILAYGWRWAYVAMGVGALLVFAMIPRSAGPDLLPESVESGGGRVPDSALRLQGVAAAFAVTAASALGTFAASAAVDTGISEAAAGYLVFAGGLTSILARVSAGVYADRTGSDGYRPMAVLMLLGVGVTIVLALAGGVAYGAALVLGYGTAWGWPGLMTFSVVNKNSARPAAASALVQAGVFVGAGTSPLAFGALAERLSYRVAWLFVGAGLLVAVVLIDRVGRVVKEYPSRRMLGDFPASP